MSPGSNSESYPSFAHIGWRENPGKNLNQVTFPDRESNPGHLVSRLDALTVIIANDQDEAEYMIVSGAVYARKWSVKWRKWNISDVFFEFNRGTKAAEAARIICAVYADNAIEESTVRKWFSRFKEGRFDFSDISRSGRPSAFDENRLNTLIHIDPRQCTRELANVMNCDHSTIVRHLHSMGKVKKSGIWVPHALIQNHKNQRVAISASLLAHHRLSREQHQTFLSNIVTGDEKWCLYANIRKRKERLSPNKKQLQRASTKYNVMHLVELRGCAVLRIAFPRCKPSQPTFIAIN
ncbi:hypothetical protein ANN_17853 [Periplaneta americana]|uniref:Mos1 transposase HTH domain-containing protein n=1 Tax=Periplaneta americana TaxID=6978 RepID=A0ABQ8SUN4_PERAM|nr:hypothetical protein ANN_17853 [Periplaneta americana]